MGSMLQARQVWYQFIQPLVTLVLASIVGAKVVVTLADGRCSMGEAIVRLARRAARHSMTMVPMEGIVMFVWSFINVGVFRYAVIWDVSNRRCRSSCKVDAGSEVVCRKQVSVEKMFRAFCSLTA
jgi:hypothetical protein